jgi:small-conductance mechanosensitive channel
VRAWLADPRLRTVLEVGDVLIFWMRDDTELGLSQVHEEIDRRFREAGVEIPLPVRRIVLEAGAAAPRSPQEA